MRGMTENRRDSRQVTSETAAPAPVLMPRVEERERPTIPFEDLFIGRTEALKFKLYSIWVTFNHFFFRSALLLCNVSLI